MRYSPTHKQQTRERLLASSSAIAKAQGFDATGVDALMAAIGLTGGAFYSHFDSKEALFEVLVEREIERTAALLGDDAGHDAAIEGYLGLAHVGRPDAGCVLPALGAEIARSGPRVRALVERTLRKTHRRWTRRLGGDAEKAWALIGQCIGGVLLARVVESERTKRAILAGSRRAVLHELG